MQDREKNIESTLWKMNEQLMALQGQGNRIDQQMRKIREELAKLRDERMKAERFKKADKEVQKE